MGHVRKGVHQREPSAQVTSYTGSLDTGERKNLGAPTREEWLNEQNSPELDIPPSAPSESRKSISDLIGAIPSKTCPFNEHEWDRISTLGDRVISPTGSIEIAAHCFVAEWGATRNPTAMTPHGVEIFERKVESSLFERGLQMATRGVDAQSHAPPIRPPSDSLPLCQRQSGSNHEGPVA